MKEYIQLKKEQLAQQWQQLKKDLSGMTFGQKLRHLAGNYWPVLVFVLVVVFFGWFAGNAVTSRPPTPLICGVSLNVQVSDAGSTYLTEQFQDFCGSDATAFLDTQLLSDAEGVAAGFLDEGLATLLMTRIYACELDYLLVDHTIFDALGYGYFVDLRELFTEQELSGWTLIYKTNDQTGESYPVGFDITELPFTKDCVQGGGRVYLTATSGTFRLDAFKSLLSALKQW